VPFGTTARRAFSSAEIAAMKFVSPEGKTAVIFEEMGFRYIARSTVTITMRCATSSRTRAAFRARALARSHRQGQRF